MSATDKNLNEALSVGKVRQSELEYLLSEYCHGAAEFEVGGILYPGDESNFAVRITYDDGLIKDVTAGPALTDSDLHLSHDEVASELLVSKDAKIASRDLFANVPTDSCFRYKDVELVLATVLHAPIRCF